MMWMIAKIVPNLFEVGGHLAEISFCNTDQEFHEGQSPYRYLEKKALIKSLRAKRIRDLR